MRKLAAAASLAMLAATPAFAATNKLKVSPNPVTAGKSVKVSGSAHGCTTAVKLSSRAFSKSVNAQVRHGKFSAKARTKSSADGHYTVSASCGGKKFGSGSFNVAGFYWTEPSEPGE